MEKQTLALHTQPQHADVYGALNMPVYHSAAYGFQSAEAMNDAFVGRSNDPSYSRVTNPTVTFFEDRVKQMSGAKNVYAFNSGMAAIANTIVALTASGRNIVTSKHLFGNTVSLFTNTMGRFGVETRYVDLLDPEQVDAAIDDKTALIYFEIVTNPQLEVADISILSEIARRHNIPLVADTTVIPFSFFDASGLGIDIEVISSTKYISGGATSLGGVVIDYGRFPSLYRSIKFELLYNLGAYMTPHAAYMQTIGLETLSARYTVHAANALELAKRLQEVPEIKRVNYIGLPDNPFYDLARKQFGETSGAMITIDLDSKQACFNFINHLNLISRATNMFDSKTLAIHPASTIFGAFAGSQRRAMDVRDTTIRLSVGLESVNDLFEDILQALH